MLESLNITNLLAIDIETVPIIESYNGLDEHWKKLWTFKSEQKFPGESPSQTWLRAGLFSEFGKIICIGVSSFAKWGSSYQFRTRVFADHDEIKLLKDFSDLLEKHCKTPAQTIAAHNGREFDFPFIGRRMLINRLDIPPILDISGKKPWEINLIDSMDLWKFGDYKSYTTLNLIAAAMGLNSHKDDMDGSMVYNTYYVEKNLEKIAEYCRQDVVLLGKVLLRFKGEADIPDEFVSIVK